MKQSRESVKALEAEGYHPIFQQLDVTDGESVKKFADFVKNRHSGIDILINNAGIVSKDITGVSYEDAIVVINTNFNSILTVEKYIFPILNDKARVINMSTECGQLSKIKNKYWIKRLAQEDVTLNDIQDFTKWFIDSVKNNTIKEEDFEWSIIFSYVVSKIAVSAYTR
ncbi:unnamed protein product [Pieris brassicae]|uniref:Uncharacterized protein n=1 Tax=Pieris brassicae TaxID=7116 RepID=A0A9P0X9M3_PIEBR|nr:unnamed protein product [Pieris brassicae]